MPTTTVKNDLKAKGSNKYETSPLSYFEIITMNILEIIF